MADNKEIEKSRDSGSDAEKVGEKHASEVDGLPPDPDEGLSEKEKLERERKLLWKLDIQLIPWLSLLYLMSFLDRTNIGNAKIAGLQESLGLSKDGSQYAVSLSIFFITYSLFEPLTNVLLKRLRPSLFLPLIMIGWGICMTCMGLVKDFGGLATTRILLGVCEAGLFPGVNYYLSCWYKRSEFGVRAAIFFSAAALAGSFGGLLAYVIEKMDGVGGKPGWAWIFILEGLLTVVVGALSFFFVHDFPDNAKFLSLDDRARVIRRLKLDNQSSAEHESFSTEYLWAAAKDMKTWLSCIVYMGCDMPLYAFSLFLPTIIKSLGTYTTVQAQLLTVPPYFAAACCTVGLGFYADRTRQRGIPNACCALLGTLGFAMLLGVGGSNPSAAYAGTVLAACGIYPAISNTIAWTSNNVEGVYKRGVVLGVFIGWGNLNGVVSSNIFRQPDAPRYVPGHATVLAYLTVCLFGGSIFMHLWLRKENAVRRRGGRDYRAEGKTAAEIEKLGDKRPDFIYTL